MKRTIKDFDLEGKKVIIRCDLNVPMEDNIITDDTRIVASLRTIKYALRNNAKVILLSHLGKIKKEEDKAKNSLYPVSIKLSEYLNKDVLFSPETHGQNLTTMAENLEKGQVLLIENTRYEDIPDKKESNCDDNLSKYWASLGEIFINDAYGSCHRNHASVTGIPKYLPSGIGFLVEKELQKIDNILDSKTHPFVAVLGGKKEDDKITLIESLVQQSDKLIIGGAMSFTFLKAKGYNTGNSIISTEHLDFAKNMLDKYSNKIVLPIDFITETEVKDIEEFSSDDIGYDIGPKTIKLFEKELEGAKRVILNGPMGLFEDKRYSKGTSRIFKYLDKNKIKTVIGGGDSAFAVNSLGFADSFYHVSTGGGATMKYLENRSLVGIEAIEDKKEVN